MEFNSGYSGHAKMTVKTCITLSDGEYSLSKDISVIVSEKGIPSELRKSFKKTCSKSPETKFEMLREFVGKDKKNTLGARYLSNALNNKHTGAFSPGKVVSKKKRVLLSNAKGNKKTTLHPNSFILNDLAPVQQSNEVPLEKTKK